jgi:hypothetical protein
MVKAYFVKLGDDAKAVFSENQDNLPLATYCSRFSELLSSLAALLSSAVRNLPPYDHQPRHSLSTHTTGKHIGVGT